MSDPINRLYDTVFHREPDTGGYAFWTDLAAHGTSLHDIAAAFVTAPEFSATYGEPSNEAFVESLYTNTLHRHSDPGGLAAWSGALNLGLLDRAAVVVGFSESAEHIANLDRADRASLATVSKAVVETPAGAPKPTGQWFSHQLRDGSGGWLIGAGPGNDAVVGTVHSDSIAGGKGGDVLTGNGGNDTFRFSSHDGYDRITDYHQGDQIQITGPAGMQAMIIAEHGPPAPGQSGPGFGGYAVVYTSGGGFSSDAAVHLDGITGADLPWVQASIHVVIA